jgi:hypothetical protein
MVAIIFDYLIGILAVFGFSFAGALNWRTRELSTTTFLAGVTIGIGVLIWVAMIPFYSVIISALCIIGMIFMGSGESHGE